MLVPIPTPHRGYHTHAVKPGANRLVSTALSRYWDVFSKAAIISMAIGMAIFLIGMGLTLGNGMDTLLGMFGSLIVGAALAGGIFGATISVAKTRLMETVEGLVIDARSLDSVWKSGKATDEQEWEAAHLAEEARELRHQAWLLAHSSPNYAPARIPHSRAAEVRMMRQRALALDSQVGRLLDPPRPRSFWKRR